MPHFANKRKATFAMIAGNALVLLACSLSFGTISCFAAGESSPTDRISRPVPDSVFHDKRTPFFQPGDAKKFFANLRFWEKERPQQPQARPPQPTVAHTANPERPQTAMQSHASPAARSNAPIPQRSIVTGIAPVPPPNPYTEHENSLAGNLAPGNAPLPAHSAHAQSVDLDAEVASQEVGQASTSFSSYSFDTRDWVEYFPQQELGGLQSGMPTLIQTTSFRPDTPQNVAQGSLIDIAERTASVPRSQNDAEIRQTIVTGQRAPVSEWDGHATALAALPAVPAAVPPAVPAAVPTAVPADPKIDLTPTYKHRLNYSQTRGVVVIQANFPLTEIAPLLSEIEQLQHDLNRYIGVPAPKEKIELCLFKDEASYIAFLREFFPRAPRDRRALFVKLDNKPGTLLVQRSKDFEIDLRHEMTHAIIHASVPRVPIWLDEGLAKYFEVPSRDRANNHPYASQIRWNARMGMVPSLDRLSKLETISDMGAKEYRDSWAWVHFMIHHSPQTHQMLAAYLQMLAEWEPGERYAQKGLAFSYGNFEKAFSGKSQSKQESAPSLKLYLDDVIKNQREAFREHFGPDR